MTRYVLGIDQGTTGTTALLFNDQWKPVGRSTIEHRQIYPQAGWVEHDAQEIWDAVLTSAKEAMKAGNVSAHEIAAIGIAHQGETCVIWDKKTGAPLHNALVWQDRRTSEMAERLGIEHGDLIKKATGLSADAYFSATKLKWMLDNVPDARRRAESGEVLGGTLDTYIIWRLTGAFVTDHSTASRTMLYNIEKGIWDDDMLSLMGIPRCMLPEIVDSSAVYGYTFPDVFFGERVAVSACITDGPAAPINPFVVSTPSMHPLDLRKPVT